MRERLKRAGMWPPDKPTVPKRSARYYFRHTEHPKALEVSFQLSETSSCVFESCYAMYEQYSSLEPATLPYATDDQHIRSD